MSIQDETQAETQDDVRAGERIAKVMARAGLCSRRDAEQWIADGRVVVNGEALTSPAFNVSEADDVRVDGQPLRAAERTRLFLFHKPRGLVTTAKDPEGRPTIFEALPQDLPRVVTVGRLDINTEGLILLTNDGGLSRVLELPATGWLRRYRVRAHGEITQEQLDGLRNGITLDGIDYLGIEAKFERQQGANVWLTMGLREGKNREIKRVLEHMGLSVNRLIRVSFGPFELGDLPEGEIMEVRTRVLRDQLGPKLTKQAGANFEAPVEAHEPAPEPPRGDRPLRRPRGDAPSAPAAREPARREDAPRKRKHVSVLRAEAREEAAGPRKRVSRTATADRKGREIKVERVSLVNPPMEGKRIRRPASEDGFGPRRATGAHGPRAEGADEKRYDRPARRPPGEGFAKRAPRAEGADEKRYDRPARRPSGEGFAKRAPRAEGADEKRYDRPARRPSGEGFAKRAPRAEGADEKRYDRPARRPAGEGFEKRAPRAEGAGERRYDRPARRPAGEGFAKRAPRAEGADEKRYDRPARRPAGEGFAKRAPRAEGADEKRYDRPARRPAGEGFAKRAPRAEGSDEKRYDRPARRPAGESFRAPRAEGAGEKRYDRPARRAPSESFDKRERAPREGADKRPARARPSSGPKGPPRGGKPGGGKPGGGKGPPRKPRG